jgi:GntR family transcriptional regulator
MLSTSYEPLALTEGTPVMLPERGPMTGRGVTERMASIGQRIVTATEVVSARPVMQDEAERIQVSPGTIVIVIQRTYWTAEQPVETADIVVPIDRYELLYVIPVEGSRAAHRRPAPSHGRIPGSRRSACRRLNAG